MKQLIYPAIALMNRLPMVYKFSLISILFLLPIGGLSWLVMSQLNQSVQTMTRGVEGLEQLRKVEELLAASMAYRDYRAPGVLKNEDALLAASDDQAETIDATLESLLVEQHSFDTSGSWAQQVTAIQEDWQALRADDNYQGNIDPQFKYYQEFVQKVLALLPATIEISGLGQDASRQNQLLLGLVREALPEARSVIGQARSYGTFALVEGQVGYALSEVLNGIYDQLTNRATLLEPALSVASDASDQFAGEAGNTLDRVNESLIVVRDLLELKVISPMRLEMPWPDYDGQIQAQLAHYDELAEAIFDVVQANLSSRLEQEVNQRRLIVVALIAILLVVVYLYLGFFMSVRNAINRFTEAARNVAAGDMTTHINLQNRDELGELTSEFNNMTD
ncbi:HAMP domain-containing protein, partial [Marinobacter sp.]